MMINIDEFLHIKKIEFNHFRYKINWVKKLNPKTLVRIEKTYFQKR